MADLAACGCLHCSMECFLRGMQNMLSLLHVKSVESILVSLQWFSNIWTDSMPFPGWMTACSLMIHQQCSATKFGVSPEIFLYLAEQIGWTLLNSLQDKPSLCLGIRRGDGEGKKLIACCRGTHSYCVYDLWILMLLLLRELMDSADYSVVANPPPLLRHPKP